MKIQLSVSENYCPDWGVWEGVREIVQNWMDSRDAGHGGSVEHDGDVMTCTNDGAELRDDHVVLLGEGDKPGEARGAFREGLKIGMLALVRSGLGVRIRSGDKTWRASIEPGQTGTRVLTLQSRKAPRYHDGVTVEVTGLSGQAWGDMMPRFRFDGERGLLLDCPGDVFVKGIWVCRSECEYGYDLSKAKTDRDRKIVNSFDFYWEVARCLVDAFRDGSVSATRMLGLLQSGAEEVRYVDSFLDGDDKAQIEQAFVDQYGANALPVSTQAEADALEHLGVRTVTASDELVELTKGLRERVRAQRSVTKEWEFHYLEESEREMLAAVLALVDPTLLVNIVSFADPSTLGSREDNVIQISRTVLGSFKETLKTVVEEVAHERGGDGSQAHKERMHELYADIVHKLYKN